MAFIFKEVIYDGPYYLSDATGKLINSRLGVPDRISAIKSLLDIGKTAATSFQPFYFLDDKNVLFRVPSLPTLGSQRDQDSFQFLLPIPQGVLRKVEPLTDFLNRKGA